MARTNRANYSIGEKISNAIALVYTKIFWRGARLIRKGCHIRGKRSISFKEGFTLGYGCRIECNGECDHVKLYIGRNCVIGDYAHIVANNSVTIGNNVLMASRIFITDSNHGTYGGEECSSPFENPNDRALSYKSVVIGDNVWIGENVCILPGVEIGNGCIIGAGAIVTKSVPDNCIVAGNPAKIIKEFDVEKNQWTNKK